MNNDLQELDALEPTELDAGTVFSGTSSGKEVRGFAAPCRYTPIPSPDYVFHESSRDIIVWFLDQSDPLYVFGPTGSGKTSLIKELAARLHYPVFEVTAHGRLEFADLVGHLAVREGSMEYTYGPLTLAMRYGGLFLLNEIDLVSPDVAAGCNGILDGQPLCLAENGGELVSPHPMFRFAATANTNGSFDETGLYQGTLQQNLAFMDRFWLCEVGYPEASAELALLERQAEQLPESVRSRMVEYAQEVRKLFVGQTSGEIAKTIEVTFSTRTLLRWAALTLRFQPLARQGIQPVTYALDRALAYRATKETQALLHELAQRLFPLTA
ncbi:AAA family ATPase [Solidesulfovibrio alcoholivorans]|uniref:AAA family ATPase n=1 Tax=Solidesulfovibrio alcoholivorans TaxID=81406 RepID=UPI00049696E2|nr:AAA family ATPase [Solidesulfovibrio alcoholivorans]